MATAQTSDAVCKIVLLGDGSVGKTSLIQRIIDDGFQPVYKQTKGLDFFERLIVFPDGFRAKLEVWDVGGQSIASKMIGRYIWGAKVVFLCYDVTNAESFKNLSDWLNCTEKVFSEGTAGTDISPPFKYLMGNKIDLLEFRKVTEKAHDRYISSNNLNGGYFVSARNGDLVLRSLYHSCAESLGKKMSSYDLSFMDKVVSATVRRSDEGEARTEFADEIERQDREAAEKSRKKQDGGCCILQ